MKLLQILLLLTSLSTVIHAQQPEASDPDTRICRPLSKNQKNCLCCFTSSVCYFCYVALTVSDNSRMYGNIKSLKSTSHGRMTIEHFKQLGVQEAYKKIAKEFYQKGLNAGHTSCPISPLMKREDTPKQTPTIQQIPAITDDYETCFCLSSVRSVQIKKTK